MTHLFPRCHSSYLLGGEGGPALVVFSEDAGDVGVQALDVREQLEELRGLGAVVEGGDQLDRPGDVLEVGLQLAGDGGVEHGGRSRRRGGCGGRRAEEGGETARRGTGWGSPRAVDRKSTRLNSSN